MSPTTKLDVDSDDTKTIDIVESFVVDPSVTPVVSLYTVIVGAALSYVQLNSVAAVLLFPARSVKAPPATLIVVAPSEEGVNVAV